MISITRIFEVCSFEAGVPFTLRGRRAACPFHGNATSFSLQETLSAWHCFSAGCPHPSGGYLDVPVAFGFANNRSEASRWLAERGLIPPARKTEAAPPVAVAPRRYVDLDTLNERRRDVWRAAQLDLVEEVGTFTWAMFRARSAEARAERFERHARIYRSLMFLVEGLESAQNAKPKPPIERFYVPPESLWDEIEADCELHIAEEIARVPPCV